MNNHNDLILALSNIHENELLHVFLIPNQTALIVTRLIISNLDLKETDFLLIPLRKTDTSLIKGESLIFKESFFSKALIKLLNVKPFSNKILKRLHKINRPFILYASWAHFESLYTPSVEQILFSNLCRGHFYIEEGQLTHRYTLPYASKTEAKQITTYAMDSKFIFRDDAIGYIGLLQDAFPGIPHNKKYIMKNFDDLKKFYKPRLKGIKNIALTCAERRLKNDQWKAMIKTLIDNMPNGGVIKLHPSFASDKIKRNKIKSVIKSLNNNLIKICPDDVIIEIEMLYEEKILVGSLTSLSKYAESFGSKFINVDLY